jgi:4-hydroxy-3-polyprenylbenzoate decarboxylase
MTAAATTGPVAVAWTGASGALYGVRLVECLLQAGREVWLMYSQAAQVVWRMELDMQLPAKTDAAEAGLSAHFGVPRGQLRVFSRQQWTAPPASGSNPPAAMVICPCTAGTLAAVAQGLADDLITRAADVMLKERRKLVLVLRETPYSSIHLENMLALTRAGAVVMSANPGFYHRPQGIMDLVDFVVARVLDQVGVPHRLMTRWGDDEQGSAAT